MISVIGVIDVIGVITFCNGPPFLFICPKKRKKKEEEKSDSRDLLGAGAAELALALGVSRKLGGRLIL